MSDVLCVGGDVVRARSGVEDLGALGTSGAIHS